jgi:hypothetical protein
MATIVLQNVTGRVLVRLRRLARLHHRSVSAEAGIVAIAQLRRLPEKYCFILSEDKRPLVRRPPAAP